MKLKNPIIKAFLLTAVLLFSAVYVNAQTTLTRTETIALLNYLALESELTRLYQDDSLLLDDIYNRIENTLDPGLLQKESRTRIKDLFDNITDFSIIDLKRERVKQLRDRAKARAVQQAIPSPMMLLSLTNRVRDPLALVINIAGMAANRVTSYLNATEQAEMQFFEKTLELDVSQKQAVNRLRSGMFDHMATIATANGLRGNDTVSRSAIETYVDIKNEKDLSTKLLGLLDLQNVYEKFFPYWGELANTYYQTGRYRECLSAIEKYESLRAPIYRQYSDSDYVETLLNGINALSHVYQNDQAQYIQRTLAYLKKIEDNAPFGNWLYRYGAALVYIDLASLSSGARRTEYLTSAYNLFRGNVRVLAINQRELLTGKSRNPTPNDFGYLQEIPAAKKGEANAEVLKQLREARKIELPPINESLLTNCTALYQVMKELNISTQEKNEIAGMLNEALFVPVIRMTFLDEYPFVRNKNTPISGKDSLFAAKINNVNTGKVVGRWVGGTVGVLGSFILTPAAIALGNWIGDMIDPNPAQSIALSFPVVFLLPDCTINVKIVDTNNSVVLDDKKVPVVYEKAMTLMKEVARKGNDLNEFRADILIPLPAKVKLDKKNSYRIEFSIVTKYGTQNIHYFCPAGESDFTEYRVFFN